MEHRAAPPLNPVCRKPAFTGGVACGTILRGAFLPAKASVWGVAYCTREILSICGTVSNSSISL